MRAASATERIPLVDENPPVRKRAPRLLIAAEFSPTLAGDGLDDTTARLPACDCATQRWESVVFLVLGLAGIVAIGLAVFDAF